MCMQHVHCNDCTQACRLFALSRMVDVLLYNLSRVHDLWPILLDHIVELLSDSRAALRTTAVDALGRTLTGALAACVSSPSQVPIVNMRARFLLYLMLP